MWFRLVSFWYPGGYFWYPGGTRLVSRWLRLVPRWFLLAVATRCFALNGLGREGNKKTPRLGRAFTYGFAAVYQLLHFKRFQEFGGKVTFPKIFVLH